MLEVFWRAIEGRGVRWAPIPLRLIVGYGFIEHGYAKLARGPGAFAQILHALGVPAPHLMAWATILVELLGGLAVLAGALIPVAGLPMAVVLIVAIVTVHLPNGFSSIKLQSVTAAGAHFGQPGYETDLLYLAGLASLALTARGRSQSMAGLPAAMRGRAAEFGGLRPWALGEFGANLAPGDGPSARPRTTRTGRQRWTLKRTLVTRTRLRQHQVDRAGRHLS